MSNENENFEPKGGQNVIYTTIVQPNILCCVEGHGGKNGITEMITGVRASDDNLYLLPCHYYDIIIFTVIAFYCSIAVFWD